MYGAKTVNLTAGPNGGVINLRTSGNAISVYNSNARLNINGGIYSGTAYAIDCQSGQVVITAGQFNGIIYGAFHESGSSNNITIASGSTATPANWRTVTAASVTVTAPSYKPGDINRDGIVNISDLNILLANYNLSGTAIINPNADLNNDNIVNISDLNILLANYGK